MKIRHILLALLVMLAIAFMQPLITFLGGLTLLVGVGILIFRDLSPTVQDTVERRMIDWLRRARAGGLRPESEALAVSKDHLPATSGSMPEILERPRRTRAKAATLSVTGPANNGGSMPPTA